MRALGYGVAAVSHDPVPILKRFGERRDIGFALLSDSGSEIIPAFGLLNESFPPGSRWRGIAHPMTVVVDAEGVVRHRFSERRYQDRPGIDSILDVLRREAGG